MESGASRSVDRPGTFSRLADAGSTESSCLASGTRQRLRRHPDHPPTPDHRMDARGLDAGPSFQGPPLLASSASVIRRPLSTGRDAGLYHAPSTGSLVLRLHRNRSLGAFAGMHRGSYEFIPQPTSYAYLCGLREASGMDYSHLDRSSLASFHTRHLNPASSWPMGCPLRRHRKDNRS